MHGLKKGIMNNKRIFRVAAIFVTTLFLLACGRKNPAFEAEYTRLHAEQGGEGLVNGLISLESANPDQGRIKLDLGAIYLGRGDLSKARSYLEAALRLERSLPSKDSRYALRADLAELELRSGASEKAVARAGEAVALVKADPLGVVYTRAKAYADMGKKTEALADLDSAWKTLRDKATAEDCRVYIGLLVDAGRLAEAIAILDHYQDTFPYEFGIGILESQCYEKMGDIDRSVVAAYKELEYAHSYGAVDTREIESNLADLRKRLDDTSWNPKGQGMAVLDALLAYGRSDPRAVALLGEAGKLLPGESFLDYARIGLLLESGNPDSGDIKAYLELERHFKALPSYYARLWRGARRLAALSGLDASMVVEKCIDLAPTGPYAAPSRAELCRLSGIAESYGPRILTDREIGAALADAVGSRNGDALDRLVSLLDTPDNRYAAACQAALREVKSDAFVGGRLQTRLAGANGRLKDRLTYIMAP